jgi:nanoRNase/pAp phosphatase (c-di-AMP/oligoRNAs hydrolase)
MRLLTRSDFDGLACAVLLEEKGLVDSYRFVHPKDVQDGRVEVGASDILAKLPFVPGCGLWFDHHANEADRLYLSNLKFKGAIEFSASAAQVIWDYYGGEVTFGSRFRQMRLTANIADMAAFTEDEVMAPEGWILLSFLVDPRTGLGNYRDYRIGNYELMLDIIHFCRTMPIQKILAQPDVKQRVDRYFSHQRPFREMLKKASRVRQNLIVTNLLEEETIYCGNRFIIYGLYPEQNIEIRIMRGRDRQTVAVACGHSILNRSSRTNVGRLMQKYGGGGHSSAGTCQLSLDEWEEKVDEICQTIVKDG